MDIIEVVCRTCWHWRAKNDSHMCTRYPPVRVPHESEAYGKSGGCATGYDVICCTGFPSTDAEETCGEWKHNQKTGLQ